jgi:hypothetical protein
MPKTKTPRAPKAPKIPKHEAWLAQPVNQCAVLGIDSGDDAGVSLWVPGAGGPRCLWTRAVKTNTRALEAALEDAVREARARNLRLVLYAEEWGAGGPLGIDQWLGLGAAIGAWKRAAILLCETARPTIVPSRLMCRVLQVTWRSDLGMPFGTYVDVGKKKPVFVRHDAEGWKKAANARVFEMFGHIESFDTNAAEAMLIGYHGMRSPAVFNLMNPSAKRSPTGGTRKKIT